MAQYIEIVTETEKNVYTAGESKIFFRRIDQAVVRQLQKKWTTPAGINRKTGQRETKTNDDEWFKDMLDYIIIGWEGVRYPQHHPDAGKEVPCTRETKFKLPARIREEIWELAESESVVEADAEEAEKKT